MADWLGQVSWLLDPLVERLCSHVMASPKLHADDTPVPVLAPGTGKTSTGRLWVYLRDNRRWSPSDKPAALFRYSPDRKGERPREHLAAFAGFLQADAYAGFDRLYDPNQTAGVISPVACWAHVAAMERGHATCGFLASLIHEGAFAGYPAPAVPLAA